MPFAKRVFIAVAMIALVVWTGCSDKTSDYQLTDLYQITQLLNNDAVATSIYPQTWIDTTSRVSRRAPTALAAESITPDDYWVEIVAHKRTVPTATDSCLADELNQDDPCAEIQVDATRRAHVRNATIRDSLVCQYHIIDAATQAVTTKSVTFTESLMAMMAKFSGDDAAYRGWSLYAIGSQWQRYTNNASAPVIDSVVLQWAGEKLVSRPRVKATYLPLENLPRISRGEPVIINVYANTADQSSVPEDVYLHYEIDGVMRHFLMDDEGSGHFSYVDMEESSAGPAGSCSQIVIEAFHPSALRDATVTTFANFIWAITYRISE